MNPKIEKLKQEQAVNERRLAQLQHKKQQLENRIRYYEQGERRKRAHRLITKGAAIESVAPTVREMSESEFYRLVEEIFSIPEVKTLLSKEVG